MWNIDNIVTFLYYLFSFTPFLHNKTVVANATFFLFKNIVRVHFYDKPKVIVKICDTRLNLKKFTKYKNLK